jgi:hypothetical protein
MYSNRQVIITIKFQVFVLKVLSIVKIKIFKELTTITR